MSQSNVEIKKKTCFVVMGFGKKQDYNSSKIIDLDLVYKKVLQPLFCEQFLDYKLIRADDLKFSGNILKDMYTYLFEADLVIADLTTWNANAAYELGVRFALRPSTTIVLCQKSGNSQWLPFDIRSERVISYGDLSDATNVVDNINKLKEDIASYIRNSESFQGTHPDSPIYNFMQNLNPPHYNKGPVVSEVPTEESSETIASLMKKALESKEQLDFSKADEYWGKLLSAFPNNSYFIQQRALCMYKSGEQNFPDDIRKKKNALVQAWEIIKPLNPESSLDTETLGISGAICKNMYWLLKDQNERQHWLDKAIYFYKRGYYAVDDYYNGENYTNCLLYKEAECRFSEEDFSEIDFERRKVCKEIIRKLIDIKCLDEWEMATLSNSYLQLGDDETSQSYQEEFFRRRSELSWQRSTFERTRNENKKALELISKLYQAKR